MRSSSLCRKETRCYLKQHPDSLRRRSELPTRRVCHRGTGKVNDQRELHCCRSQSKRTASVHLVSVCNVQNPGCGWGCPPCQRPPPVDPLPAWAKVLGTVAVLLVVVLAASLLCSAAPALTVIHPGGFSVPPNSSPFLLNAPIEHAANSTHPHDGAAHAGRRYRAAASNAKWVPRV